MIAVHTFGHLRTVLECMDSFRANVLAPLGDHRLFIHTWSETNRRTPSWYEVQRPIREVGDDLIETVRESLRPTALQVDPQILTDQERGLNHVSALMMHKSIRRSLALRTVREDAEAYDMVVMTRLDVRFDAPIDVLQFRDALHRPPLDRSVLAISRDHTSWSKSIWISDRFGGRDVFFFGSRPVMDRFRGIGLNPQIYTRHPLHERTGEVAFDNFIYSQGLNLQLVDIIPQTSWGVVRE